VDHQRDCARTSLLACDASGVRAAALTLLLAVSALTGCAHAAPPPAAPAPKPPVPCLSQANDGLFTACLRTELDEVWGRAFRDTGRTYIPPQLTVGDGPGPRGDGARDDGPDRAFFSPRSGIHLPTQYLDAVHTAHGPRSPLVLTFTMSHETGHNVQFLLHPRVDARVNDLEAQADCYAGAWARKEADAGRLDTAQFRAAAAAELDRLSTYPHEVATHGDLAQRLASLDKGLHGGDPAACDIGQLTWR
jgi:uncharacterized protein